MWQRVQTLYLALSLGLVTALFFCDKAEGVSFMKYLPYVILTAVTALLTFLALTTYRHRVFQARTAVFAALVAIGLQAWLGVDFFFTGNELPFRLPAVFPIVSAILDFMAARNIWSDELMVRSSSRLRPAKRKR